MARSATVRRVGLGVVLLLVLVLVVVLAVRLAGRSAPAAVTVMTRNLYLGGDITRPVAASQGRTGRDALVTLGQADHALRAVVDETDFAVRSRLLAAEVAAARPDLLGLQEVALWRHGPLQLDAPGRLDATEVDLDFLALLQPDLTVRGAVYDVVGVQDESDVEAPSFTGDPLAGTATAARDVRLTLRDALLVRRDAPVEVTASGGARYTARLDVDLGGVPFAFVRGYLWADVTVGSSRFRFTTTHLESQSAELAAAQAAELLTGPPGGPGRPGVLVGDLNAQRGDPAFERLAAAGWQDAAAAVGPTAALSETVDDATAAGLDRRIDHVLVRGTAADPVTPVRAERTGADPADRDPTTGLWPSDHAGVLVVLRIG